MNNIFAFDRICLKNIDVSLVEQQFLGRYLTDPKEGIYFVPNSIESASETDENKVSTIQDFIWDILEIISIDLNQTITSADKLRLSPLIRNFTTIIELDSRDHSLIDVNRFKHIEKLLRKPEIDIKKTVERLHISKVKRINYKAVSFLATHSEDWESRLLHRITPKKLLAEFVDVDYEIYENIVIKTLVDKLVARFIKKMRTNDRIGVFLEELKAFKESGNTDNYLLRKRISELWTTEQYESLIQESDKVGECKTLITSFLNKLKKCSETKLYKIVKKKINWNSPIKKTNLFSYNDDYRMVKEMWNELIPHNDPNYISTKFNKRIKLFNEYFIMCFSRGLDALGFSGFDSLFSAFAGEDRVINFQNKFFPFDINLKISVDKTIELKVLNETQFPTLIILPISTELNNLSTELADLFINDINFFDRTNKVRRVIVYHGLPNQKHNLSYFQKKAHENMIEAISISPMDIFSVERLQIVLNNWCYFILANYYPCKIRVNNQLLKINREFEDKNVKIKAGFVYIYDNSINTKKLLETHIIAKNKSTSNEIISSEINSMLERMNYFHRCPYCKRIKVKTFELRDNECYECTCSNCASIYGIKYCDQCKNKVPYLKIKHFETLVETIILSDGDHGMLKNELFGRDLLTDYEIINENLLVTKWLCNLCQKRLK